MQSQESSSWLAIPVLDPDTNLLKLLKNIRKLSNIPVILVNDGSSNPSSLQILEEAKNIPNIHYLQHAVNQGKGRALKTAFNYYLNQNPQGVGVVTADGDGQHSPKDILTCAELLQKFPRDLVLGCRDFSKELVPWKSKLGNQLTKGIFFLATRIRFSDTQTGLRGIPAYYQKALLTTYGERFEFETLMLLRCSEFSVHLKETAIETIYLNSNKATHFRPFHDSLAIYKLIFAYIYKQLLKFTVSSLLSAALDLFLFWLFFRYIFSNKPGSLVASVCLARSCSLIFNYILNKSLVFQYQHEKTCLAIFSKSFNLYFLLCIFIMLCSYLLTKGGNLLFPDVNLVVLKALVDLFLFFTSYFIQKQFIFFKKG